MEFKHDQTSSNTIKHHQTRWPNGKMFDHQTIFDDFGFINGVDNVSSVSPTLERIEELWVRCSLYSRVGATLLVVTWQREK